MSSSSLELAFDRPVPPGGYSWWYLDALADDGVHALTVIGFVGSVFSPYYAWSGRRDPERHVAINVALYRPSGDRWAMTERGAASLERSPDLFRVGPSAMSSRTGALEVEVDEVGFPIPHRVQGRLRLAPLSLPRETITLDAEGQHHWRPIAPRARIEVELEHPKLHFEGDAYLDSNWGAVPLEQSFRRWNWSRAALGDRALVLYEIEDRNGRRTELGLDIGSAGELRRFELPPPVSLEKSGWGIDRQTRSEAPGETRVLRSLEDTPFYSRSLVQTRLFGTSVRQVHESLDLDRLASGWVKLLLPFRMPRRA